MEPRQERPHAEARPGPAVHPVTLDAVAAALEAASPSELCGLADTFDDVRHDLGDLAGAYDRVLGELDDAWHGASAAYPAAREPLMRTRELLHELDGAACGAMLRLAADLLAAGQTRIRDLQAQRAAGVGDGLDQQARLVLQSVVDGYRDIGVRLGGAAPPVAVAGDPGGELRSVARDAEVPLRLASDGDDDPAELFRPVTPAAGTIRVGDPGAPPGGTGGGGGMPFVPFAPPAMGGMGGMGGGGGMHHEQALSRRTAAAPRGEPDLWGEAQGGWNVVGRKVEAVKEKLAGDGKGERK